MPVGQDHRTAVVGYEFEPVIDILVVEVPADPAIAQGVFPRCCRKDERRRLLLVIGGHVPQVFTDLGRKTQVVMRRYQLVMKLLFAVLHRGTIAVRRGSRPILPSSRK